MSTSQVTFSPSKFILDLRAQPISLGSIFDWRIPVDSIWVRKIAPSLIIASCFVVLTWNPWENHVNKANVQGRGFRIKGTTAYIVSLPYFSPISPSLQTHPQIFQIIAWCSRILTCTLVCLAGADPMKDYLSLRQAGTEPGLIFGWSTSRLYFSASLILELLVSAILPSSGPPVTSGLSGIQVLFISFATLKVVTPPSIRLIEPTTIPSATRSSSLPPARAPSFPTQRQPQVQESDLFGSLTLSNNPLATIRTNPIFGSPSLQNPPPPIENEKKVEDPDAMDWIPTNPSPNKERPNPFLRAGSAPIRSRHGDGGEDFVLRRQRLFPPEEPTGLEGLLNKTVLAEPPPFSTSGHRAHTRGAGRWWARFLSANPS